jgi:hypothetical protein
MPTMVCAVPENMAGMGAPHLSFPFPVQKVVEEPMEQDPFAEEEVDVNDEDNRESLPSVDMSRVPSIFRQQIARVLANLQSRMLKKSPSNQRGCCSTGSACFPWKSTERSNWPAPFTLKRPATFADFLSPQFGSLCFFAPDKGMPHHALPNGRMPCKWHG